MNYNEFAKKTRSQKVTLAIVKAKQRLKNFTFVSGSTWTRVTKYFVSNVSGAPFSYDPTSSVLTITSAVNPNTLNIVVEYSFFFSNFPINQDVEYQARINDIGGLKLELDTENVGIAIETDSTIKLENSDGYFDEIYDSLIWENQECVFYSWTPSIAWSEKKLIYRGYISTKNFNEKYISFTLKDAFVKLREPLPFTGSRLIYGKAKNLDASSLDKVGNGYQLSSVLSGRNDRDLLTGVISGTISGNTITGTGTAFLTELSALDKIRVIDGLVEYSYSVNLITSNTSLTISGTISASFAGAQGRNASKLNNIMTGASGLLAEVSPGDQILVDGVKYKVKTIDDDSTLTTDEQIKDAFTNEIALNLPDINYRKKNRIWNVSGHMLGDHSTTIDTVYSQRIFSVFDIGHIVKGDIIEVASNFYTVERISGKIIFLNQNALSLIVSTNSVIKPSIQKVTMNDVEFIHGRDFTESNLITGCDITFNEFAERSAVEDKVSGVSLVFSNTSRVVTSISSTIDLTTIFSPRDWIKGYTGTVNYYEILSVEQTQLTLRTAYSEARSFTGPALYRKPDYIGDDAKILIDCMGKRSSAIDSSCWIKTASDAVKDICDMLGISNLNTASFESAKSDADYVVSLVYPKSVGGTIPISREAILDINKSVFGSLYSDNDFNISYSVLNADRDEEIELIKDEDINSFSTTTRNQIVGKVNVNYRHEVGKDAFSSYSYSNENIPGINSELNLELYLYDDYAAELMAQRYAFLRSSSQTVVTINAKLNLIFKSLNDRVYLSFERLFKRFGSSGNVKVGLVNKFSSDGSSVSLEVNDVGNLFSRVGAIAPASVDDYATATEDEISRFGFIVDNDSETVDSSSDITLGSNLIG